MSPYRLPSRPGVLVVRHGLTTWNATQRWQGWADIDLADEGVAQAEGAGAALAALGLTFPAVVSSDLLRARRTAEVIATATGSKLCAPDLRWRERHIGEWSGLTTPEIEHRWPGMLDAWRAGDLECTPSGEHEEEFATRVVDALRDALALAATHGSPCLVVSHGGVMRTLDRHTGAEPVAVPNLGGRWFESDGDRIVAGDALRLHDEDRPAGVAL